MIDCLPEEKIVKTQQCITGIIECEGGIKIVPADGTIERGDIVVGCDDGNSIVRDAIWVNAHGTVSDHVALTEIRGEVCITHSPLLISHSLANDV